MAEHNNPDAAFARMKARISLAHHITKRRMALGLSQEDLAAAIGLGRTSIVNIEQGRQGMQIEDLPAIAKALDWTLTQLIKGLDL